MAIPQNLMNGVGAFVNQSQNLNNFINMFMKAPPGAREGISDFRFDIIQEHTMEQSADITDHYAEDNSFIQDHIAFKPKKITLKGLICELTDSSSIVSSSINKLATSLPSAIPFVGNNVRNTVRKYANTAQSLYNSAKSAYDQVMNYYELYKGIAPEPTKQELNYKFLETYMKMRRLFIVITPWGTYNNMAIETIRVTQTDSLGQTDITVVLKEYRGVETITVAKKKSRVSRTAQKSQANNKGTLKSTLAGANDGLLSIFK